MGAYSTVRITRSKAKAAIIEAVLGAQGDSFLEDILDRILEGKLYESRIVHDGEDNDNHVLP